MPESLDFLPDFVVKEEFLTPNKCDDIIGIGATLDFKSSERYSSDDEKFRKSMECHIEMEGHPLSGYLDFLWESIVGLNNKFFKFDISGFQGNIRYIRYKAPDSHFSWHIDRGEGIPIRKLSFSVQLSNPVDYQGGELQIMDGAINTMPANKGSLIIFPSYVMHRVTPVTYGERHVIVGWVAGPSFT